MKINPTTNEDYLLKIKVQNNRIASLMKEKNIENVAELSRQVKISRGVLDDLINMKSSPFHKSGIDWRGPVITLAGFFGVLPDEMFNEQQLTTTLSTNHTERAIGVEQVVRLLNHEDQQRLPEAILEEDERNQLLNEALETLTLREQKVIKMRFGLDGCEKRLDDVAEEFGVSRERIRQIELRALRRLRHPRRTGKIKDFF